MAPHVSSQGKRYQSAKLTTKIPQEKYICSLFQPLSKQPNMVVIVSVSVSDDSEEVEQECQRVITSLEQLLGESLQQYF